MNKDSSLKKTSKRDIVKEDIMSQINNGSLATGDRLLPVRELSKVYGINERTLLKALQDLAEKGILENRPRDGYYVCKTQTDVLQNNFTTKHTPTHQVNDAGDFTHLYMPLPKKKSLSIYISDSYPLQVQKWENVLSDFKALHPGIELTIFTGNDGHIQSLKNEFHIDIIHCEIKTSHSLQSEGINFVPFKSLDSVGIKQTDLLDIIQNFLNEGRQLTGVPFGVGPCFMYLNKDLLKSANKYISIPQTANDLLWPLNAQSNHRKCGVEMADYKLYQLLQFDNCLTFCKQQKQIVLDDEKLLTILEKITQSDITLQSNWTTQATYLFKDGKLPYLFHMGYIAGLLHKQFNFDWDIQAVPEGLINGQHTDMVELVINKDTKSLFESLSLVKYLCSTKVQKKLAGPYGRLPARKDVLYDNTFFDNYLIPKETVLEALSKNYISYHFSNQEFNFENDINECGMHLVDGKLTAKEAADKIKFMYEHYFRKPVNAHI